MKTKYFSVLRNKHHTEELIYKNMVQNSVGPDKSCEYKKVVKNVKLKISLGAIMFAFAISFLVGCKELKANVNKPSYSSSTQQSTELNFSTIEIANFDQQRTYDFFKNNGFTEYTQVGTKRDYKYTSEDYKKVSDLDETYLFGIYSYTTEHTLNEVLNALGYENLDEFLTKNNYVNKKGETSTVYWCDEAFKQLNDIMSGKHVK